MSERTGSRTGCTGKGTVNGSGSRAALLRSTPALPSELWLPAVRPHPVAPKGKSSPAPPARPSLKNSLRENFMDL